MKRSSIFLVSALSLCVYSANQCWGIANAPTLTEKVSALSKAAGPELEVYQRLKAASGLVAFLATDPLDKRNENNGRTTLRLKAFEQDQCSAIHFKEPAFFITAAHCFTDANGQLNPIAQHARVFLNGRSWVVDPLSIWIPQEFATESVKSRYDIAIFSVLPSEEAGFDRDNTPLPIASLDTGLVPGQGAYLTASGSKDSTTDTFGAAQAKMVHYALPPAAAQADPTSPLHVRADEEVLTFASDDRGINCLYDSGGGVVLEFNAPEKDATELQLIGTILGSAGGKACEQTDRFTVAADLRFKGPLLKQATEAVAARRRAFDLLTREFQAKRKALYKSDTLYSAWATVSLDVLQQFLIPLDGLTSHETFKRLHPFMQEQKKRAEAVASLHGSSGQTRGTSTVISYIDEPSDPFEPVGSNWARGELRKGSSEQVVFNNPHPETDIQSVRLRNLGDEPITFVSPQLWTGSFYGEPKDAQTPRTLAPGESYDLRIPNYNYVGGKELTLHGFTGDRLKLRVDFLLASANQMASKRWQEQQNQLRQQTIDYNAIVNSWNLSVEAIASDTRTQRANYESGRMSVRQWNAWVAENNDRVASDRRWWNEQIRAHNLKYGTIYPMREE